LALGSIKIAQEHEMPKSVSTPVRAAMVGTIDPGIFDDRLMTTSLGHVVRDERRTDIPTFSHTLSAAFS
jgi:hypothetical protein